MLEYSNINSLIAGSM